MFKKKKITVYLQNLQEKERTTFDLLLTDYLEGSLKSQLQTLGIPKIDIHIDWLDDFKCIGVQGKYQNYYLNLQIYPDEFTISFDVDEADDGHTHSLNDKNQVYRILSDTMKHLK